MQLQARVTDRRSSHPFCPHSVPGRPLGQDGHELAFARLRGALPLLSSLRCPAQHHDLPDAHNLRCPSPTLIYTALLGMLQMLEICPRRTPAHAV